MLFLRTRRVGDAAVPVCAAGVRTELQLFSGAHELERGGLQVIADASESNVRHPFVQRRVRATRLV